MRQFERQIQFAFWCVASVITMSNASANDEKFVDFGDQHKSGREIWIDSCSGCHAYGIAGAPIPMRPKNWIERVKKDRDTLYDHAINGFFGPGDTQMPARGGNNELSDAEVVSAVDYMVALATFYIKQKDEKKQ